MAKNLEGGVLPVAGLDKGLMRVARLQAGHELYSSDAACHLLGG